MHIVMIDSTESVSLGEEGKRAKYCKFRSVPIGFGEEKERRNGKGNGKNVIISKFKDEPSEEDFVEDYNSWGLRCR